MKCKLCPFIPQSEYPKIDLIRHVRAFHQKETEGLLRTALHLVEQWEKKASISLLPLETIEQEAQKMVGAENILRATRAQLSMYRLLVEFGVIIAQRAHQLQEKTHGIA